MAPARRDEAFLQLPADGAEDGPATSTRPGPLAGLLQPDPAASARARALQARLHTDRAPGTGRADAFAAALAVGRPATSPTPTRSSVGPGAERAVTLARSTAKGRRGAPHVGGDGAEPDVSAATAPPPAASPGCAWALPPARHYPVAWALLGGPEPDGAPRGTTPRAPIGDSPPPSRATRDPAAASASGAAPVRPPAGRPTVRPPVRNRAAPSAAPASALLAQTTDAALLVARPGAGPAMQLSIRDDVFAELQCSIELSPEGVVATFYAADAHTRRLLAAEADALRVRLEGRGLTVAAVRVAPAGEGPAVPMQLGAGTKVLAGG